MKNIILSFALLVSSIFFAQTNGFNYKVLLTDSGNALSNHVANFRFTIIEDGTTSVYQETQATNTDANGIASLAIGEGNSLDDFDIISWGEHDYALKVEVDTGSGYNDMGTTAFQTVPLAKYAQTAGVADYVNHSFWHQISNAINSSVPVGVGIPVATEANLHINDVTGGLPIIKMESNDNIYTIWKSNRANVDDYSIGIDGGNNRFQFANTSTGQFPLTLKAANVGINNLNPAANLDVLGSFKLVDGTQGSDKILTSDASGNASWQSMTIPMQTYTVLYSPLRVQTTQNTYNFVRRIKEFYITETTINAAYVPIDIPAGATITQITYYYYDNASTDLSFMMVFSNVNTGSSQSSYTTHFTSSGADTNVRSETININFPVDGNYNLGFSVSPSNGTWPGDNTLSFRGIKIVYTK